MIVVGKDVLELLSSAMYIDPLSIYREYIQNAADAIDEARASGVLAAKSAGEVRIDIDPDRRSIKIRDNGAGISVDQAPWRLLSIGASVKRGTAARGFRGVGRLAGLAYCRQLTFRTRAKSDNEILELSWDCQRLKTALREVTESDDLPSVMKRIVTLRRLPCKAFPAHFFEVELSDVIRMRKDVLLNAQLVGAYLSQVAPVPFADEFSWNAAINEHLGTSACMTNLKITFGNDAANLVRPHRNAFAVSDTVQDRFSEIELLSFEDLTGNVAAVGWVLHHSYLGSITTKTRIGGLRLRIGNLQVGDNYVVEEVFPEARFNGWAVGEIHIVDRRIVPNARRDHFEQNVHYSNLMAQLAPLALSISRRSRGASIARNNAKRLKQSLEDLAQELRTAVALSPARRAFLPHLRLCVSQICSMLKHLPQDQAALALLDELKSLDNTIRVSLAKTDNKVLSKSEAALAAKLRALIAADGVSAVEAERALIRLLSQCRECQD